MNAAPPAPSGTHWEIVPYYVGGRGYVSYWCLFYDANGQRVPNAPMYRA